jgi:hypothetical protein
VYFILFVVVVVIGYVGCKKPGALAVNQITLLIKQHAAGQRYAGFTGAAYKRNIRVGYLVNACKTVFARYNIFKNS